MNKLRGGLLGKLYLYVIGNFTQRLVLVKKRYLPLLISTRLFWKVLAKLLKRHYCCTVTLLSVTNISWVNPH